MSGQIDQIRKRHLIDSPETVTTDWSTKAQTLDDRTGPFSLFLKYENGTAVSMTIVVQMSTNLVDWADITETEVPVVDNTGTVLYDIDGSGTQFVRIAIRVNSGSIDVVDAQFIGSQFH